MKVTPCAGLASVKDGRRVTVSGIVLVRQRPGSTNVTFITIEDEGGIAKVRLFDRERPTNKGKPRGVDRIVVLRYVGENPPRSLKEWNYARMAGQTKFEVEIPANVGPGTSVWLTAQWANAKGQCGPGCSPVNFTSATRFRASGDWRRELREPRHGRAPGI